MTLRIFLKLALVTVLPLLITAAALLLLVTRISLKDLERGLEASLSEKARLVDASLDRVPVASYQDNIDEIARRAGARATVIDSSGEVLADSEADPGRMENHATRPEFKEALLGRTSTSRRFSTTVQTDFLYVAIPMTSGDGAVRLALPLEEVNALAKSNWMRMALVILMIIMPLVLGVAWYSRRISKQVSSIIQLSNRISDGNFDTGDSSPKRGDLRELDELRRSLHATAGKLQSSFRALQDERSRFVAAVNGIGEGVLVADRKGRILMLNPAIRLMFPDENLSPRTRLSSWSNKDVRAIFNYAVEHGEPCTTELSIETPRPRSWRVSCAPIMSRKGKIQAVAAVFHDVTELERVDQMRRDFVINVSHELRTPLASITGYAETLMDGAIRDTKNNRRFVQILWQNAQRLTQLTSDLMTLSQIEVKAREFAFKEQSVAKLLRIATDGIRPVLESKNLGLTLENVAPDLSVCCDSSAVQQILGNLLDNAAKYTPAGGSITVGATPEGTKVSIFVRDTGIGIAKEHVPRLFERFYRVDKARSRELGGTGLGLAIVKHLVQAHGGAVWVESTSGKGSTFWFTLPDRPDRHLARLAAQLAADQTPPREVSLHFEA